jgi:hypothetical protein
VTTTNLHDDDVLFALLQAAVEAGSPLPEDAVATARAVFEMSTVDAELAQLVFDSLADAVPVGTRAQRGTGPRSLCFETAALTIDIELLDDGSIVGQVDPPSVVAGRVESSNGPRALTVDRGGRFQTRVTERRFRLRFDVGPRSVATPWIKR